jgi:hypothetical protein
MFCYYAILEGATAYHRLIKESKQAERDFVPLYPEGRCVIDKIFALELSLPTEYEEARRVRFACRNPYQQLPIKEEKKGRAKKIGKKKRGKKGKLCDSYSGSSSDDDSYTRVDLKGGSSEKSAKVANTEKKKKKDSGGSDEVEKMKSKKKRSSLILT